ncbi:DUF2637 domain-containing protein [Micromonospora sp. CA-246542]|uniref:DUF2637 domain-containing protein n=1 Tax=Micromonospora sp. CA-246542 TaxID=3239959 RepID=UPI003D935BF6
MKLNGPEQAAQILILTVVGLAAGAASFTHVHDWTMDNSPAGTHDWFGWANAVISELVPIGALLTIRRNRRTGKGIGFPMCLLLAAVALSLSAQLAVAKPSASGWLLSAVPALAFMGLSKMVLAGLPTMPVADDEPASPDSPVADAPLPIEASADADPEPADPVGTSNTPRKRRVARRHRKASSQQRIEAAEVLRRADQLKPQLGTWQKVADELGISIRTLQNYRRAGATA